MKLIKNIYLLAIATILFASCSSDDTILDNSSEEGKVQVRFTMHTRATSGTGSPANPDETLEVERFNRYWVVFTDGSADNNIVAVVKKTCELTEFDEFMVKLSPGNYKVYAFANIADSYLETLGLNVGSKMPDLSGKLFTPDNRFFGKDVTTLLPVEVFQDDYEKGNNTGIPMTSVNGYDINITNAITVNASIEVVRMFAKMEFVFSNNTDDILTLHSQSVSNLTVNNEDATGFIPLYNDDSRTFSFLDDKPFKTLSHSYGDGLELAAGATNISKAFYVLESKADEVTNSFTLNFDVTNGITPIDEADHMRYALTDDKTLTAIRRNDWIVIPVRFSDWQFRLVARSYPPIGGYPEAEIDESQSNEFRVNFKESGDFVIRPFIRKYGTDDWKYLDDTSVIESYSFTVDTDPAHGYTDIFRDGMYPTKKANEIVGAIKSDAHGTALVTITIKIKDGAGITRILTRKMYINH